MQISETQRDIKRKFNEQEDKQKVIISESQTKNASTIESQLDRAVSKMNEIFSEVKNHIQEIKNQGSSIEAITNQIENIKKDQQTILTSISQKKIAESLAGLKKA